MCIEPGLHRNHHLDWYRAAKPCADLRSRRADWAAAHPLPVRVQVEVEQFFIDGGWLFPKYHINYWTGLRQRPGGRWNFTDTTIPSPSFRTYSNWGTDGATNLTEPQNQLGNERCGVANATMAIEGAWGWNDYPCNATFVHICRIMRGWLHAAQPTGRPACT